MHDHADVIEVLTAAGAHVNEKDYNGQTALMQAAYLDHADCLKALIAAGADVNEKGGKYVGTALYTAVWKGYADIVKALIAAGADVNEKESSGETVLQKAMWDKSDE